MRGLDEPTAELSTIERAGCLIMPFIIAKTLADENLVVLQLTLKKVRGEIFAGPRELKKMSVNDIDQFWLEENRLGGRMTTSLTDTFLRAPV